MSKLIEEVRKSRAAPSTQPRQWGPWIDWNGGECPIPDAKPYDWQYRRRGGRILTATAHALHRDYNTVWTNGAITAYRVLLPADDLLRQAVEALRGLVADDLTYDGRFIIIECVNHTDAIAKVIAARAVLSLAEERGAVMATCETCKFWHGLDKDRPAFLPPSTMGVCRNPMNDWFSYNIMPNAPVRVASPKAAGSSCGEHQPKEAQDE